MTQGDLRMTLNALTDGAARPFADAVAMPPAIYASAEVLRLEQSHLFRKEWICVGRASAIAEPGAYLTYEIAGQPIVVLRDRTGSVRAFSNVCLHRMSVLLDGRGCTSVIVCPYHAWSYNLDGTLRGAPHMERTTGFRKDAYRLPEFRSEIWQGWIYVTLDPDAPPVADHLAPLIPRLQMIDTPPMPTPSCRRRPVSTTCLRCSKARCGYRPSPAWRG
jgi:choline monooxygenase